MLNWWGLTSLLYNKVYITTAPDLESRARTTSPSGETRGFEPVTNEFSVRRSHPWANRAGYWLMDWLIYWHLFLLSWCEFGLSALLFCFFGFLCFVSIIPAIALLYSLYSKMPPCISNAGPVGSVVRASDWELVSHEFESPRLTRRAGSPCTGLKIGSRCDIYLVV